MNERIKELLNEAEKSVAFLSNSNESKHQIAMQRFSELIIRECVTIVENISPGYDDYRNQIEDAFRRDCVEQIKQHFGVKE